MNTTTARLTTTGFAHERTVGEETWLTPRYITQAICDRRTPDVDPCSPLSRPWATARTHYNKQEDGFNRPWDSEKFYWVNPPYGAECPKWVAKAADQGNSLVLIFARTDTRMFHRSIWEHPNTTAVFFFSGRLKFVTMAGEERGPAGAPSCLVAYGEASARLLVQLVASNELKGRVILLNEGQNDVYRLGQARN